MPVRALNVVITGDPRPFQAALAKASAASGGFARSQTSAAQKVKATGGTLTKGLTVPLLAAGAVSVKFAANFEKQMSSLSAVTGAGAGAMEGLRKSALKAGADTAFSAQEAAEAQTELAKGGLTVQQIMGGGLKGALGLAAAGELDLADAAAYTANAINLFGLKGEQATHVADALATAANATTADVSDFGEAMVQAGSVAKSAGLSFDETIVALEALAANGVKGSDAGTSLKTALIQLIKPTQKQANLAEDLGLNFLDAQGNMKPLGAISSMLRDRLGGMTKAQRTSTMATLAGTDGVRTLTSLYDAGPKKLAKFEQGVHKQGTAADVAAKKQDNLAGKTEQLKGSLETLGIIVGTALIPPLTSVAKHLTQFANVAGEAFSGLPSGVQQAVLGIAAFAVVIGPVLVAAGAMAAGVSAIGTALAAVSLPVLAVVALVAALAIGLVVAYKRSAEFRAIVQATFAWLKTAATNVASAVGPVLVQAFNTLKATAITVFNAVRAQVGPTISTLSSLGGAIGALAVAIGGKLQLVWHVIQPIVAAIANSIGPVMRVAFSVWLGIVTRVISAIGTIFRGIINVIKGIINVVTGVLTGDFGRAWDGVKSIFSGAIGIVVGMLKAMTAPFRSVLANIKQIISVAFSTAWRLVKAVFTSGVRSALVVLKLMTAPARAAARAIGAVIVAGFNVIKKIVSAVGGFISGAVAKVKGAVSKAAGAAKSVGSAIISGVVNGVKALAARVGSKMSEAVAKVRAWIGNARSAASSVGGGIIGGVVKGVTDGFGKLAGIGRDLANKVIDAAKNFLGISSPSKEFVSIGGHMIDGLKKAILNPGNVLKVVEKFFGGIKDIAYTLMKEGFIDVPKRLIKDVAHIYGTPVRGIKHLLGKTEHVVGRAHKEMGQSAARAFTYGFTSVAVPDIGGVMNDLEANIATQQSALAALQSQYDTEDRQAEIDKVAALAGARAPSRSQIKKAKGNRARDLQQRRNDIIEAQRQLAGLTKEQERAQALADIDFKVRGLEHVKAVKDAFDELANTIENRINELVEQRIGQRLTDELSAIDTGDLSNELTGLTSARDQAQRAQEDKDAADKITEAKLAEQKATDKVHAAEQALARVRASGSQRLIDNATRALTTAQTAAGLATADVKTAEDAQAAIARDRRIEQLTADIQAAKDAAEARAQVARDGNDEQINFYKSMLTAQTDAELTELSNRAQNYQQFVNDVNAILGTIQIGSPEIEMTITEADPTPTTVPKPKAKKKRKKKAIGGDVLARMGELTRVGELGPEDVYLPRGARVTQASQSRGGAPAIGKLIINQVGAAADDANALASVIGFKVATARR